MQSFARLAEVGEFIVIAPTVESAKRQEKY